MSMTGVPMGAPVLRSSPARSSAVARATRPAANALAQNDPAPHSDFDNGALPAMTCNTNEPDAVIIRKP
ncbi:hypothetical protein SAMN04488523_105246 [Sulfitobacter brevis]|uniref:Uncharacterized protein n=1 Tax=Sulfitobacter brevis TaxID=74348 RepID=A0A1I1YH53_9RHOB|nr:hypothetical protein SAMN04488523_105246 [Sulfitobacter brevis]